ncbi:MAG: hypothetical protein LBG27_07755 [Spirochaetaceae bacterium]|jgi:hypothetical protein|nr:hypothetical protein [Spirochaetaceae bacterium]
MKRNGAARSALLLVFALVFAGCEGDSPDDGGFFEAKLRGTWETHDPDELREGYNGKVVINWDTITITGYTGYIGWATDESTRPFKDITKGVSRKGYAEDGKIYINDFGWKEGIPYEYDAGAYPDCPKLLRFTFGGRPETLRKTGEQGPPLS